MHCLRICAALAFWLALGVTNLSSQTSIAPSDAVQQFRDQGGRFEQVQLFFPLAQRNAVAMQFAPNAQFLTLDPDLLAIEKQQLPPALSLRLPYHGEVLMLDLLEVPLFTPDFTVVTNQSGDQAVVYSSSRHYRGVIRGDDHSLVAVSFGADGIMGLIADDRHGNLVLGKIDSPENETEYILYADHELTAKNPFSCTSLETGPSGTQPSIPASPEASPCVRVYFESDYELYQNKGSVQNTVDYLSGAFNQLATLYANEQISTTLSQVYVWVTPDNYSTNSSSNALKEFRAARQSFNGDLAHLVGIGGNNLGGIAYVDVLCSPYAYAFSDISTSYSTVPTYSWTVEVLTHEMGHNLGSPHTQSCTWPGGAIDNCYTPEGNCSPGPAPVNGGTIMSYCHLSGPGINFNNGFGPLPGNKIRAEVASASCLGNSCSPPGGTCAAPTGITVTNITTNSALVSWTNASGANSYILQWRVVGGPSWTTVNSPANPYPMLGLPSGQAIELRLQSQCGTSSSSYSYGPIFSTSGNGGTTCGTPENLGATVTSSTSAIISWKSVSGAVSYQLFYKPEVSSSWGTPVNLSNTSYPLNNLSPNTKYQVRVSANCSNTSSNFAQVSFTTPSGGGTAACGLPGNFSATATSPNAVTISWDAVPGAQYYQLWYKLANSYYYSSTIYVSGSSYTLNGLTANTYYHVRIRAVCSTKTSAYQTILLKTPADSGSSCPSPSNFVVNSVSSSSAVISWNTVPGAQAYDLQIKHIASASWMTFVNLPGTVIQITNMQSNTTYQVRVRARCSGSNNYSAYTNILNINTLNLNPGDVENTLPANGSQIIRLPVETATELTIFPNPATSLATVNFSTGNTTGFKLELLDLNGRPVQADISALADHQAQIDLSRLPAGVYLVRAVASEDSVPVLGRIVKQ